MTYSPYAHFCLAVVIDACCVVMTTDTSDEQDAAIASVTSGGITLDSTIQYQLRADNNDQGCACTPVFIDVRSCALCILPCGRLEVGQMGVVVAEFGMGVGLVHGNWSDGRGFC